MEQKKLGSGRNLILEKREPRDRGIPKFSKLSLQKFLPLSFVFLCGITQEFLVALKTFVELKIAVPFRSGFLVECKSPNVNYSVFSQFLQRQCGFKDLSECSYISWDFQTFKAI